MTDEERWRASEEELARRRELAERVDSDLRRDERETTMSHRGTDDRVQVTSYAPTVVRGLLRHGHARIRWIYVVQDDARNRRVDSVMDVPDVEDLSVGGLSATLPVGAWKLKGTPRQTERLSHVITTPDRAAGVRATFDGEGGDGDDRIRTDGGRELPSTKEVADEIEADPDRLRSFLKTHPNASPGYILTSFGVDLRYTDLIERWLERLKSEERQRARGGRE